MLRRRPAMRLLLYVDGAVAAAGFTIHGLFAPCAPMRHYARC